MTTIKTILFLVFGISTLSYSQSCPPVLVPDQFSVVERIISFNSSLDIKDVNKKSYGKIGKRFFALSKQFSFRDSKNQLVANGRARILSWGHHVDVTDCNGDKIGAIKEQIFPTAITGGIYSVYTFLDAENKVTAVTRKVELLSTKFNIFAPQEPQVQLATVSRSLFGKILNDKWTVQVYNNQAVDKRILIMLAVFKTSQDNDDARDGRRDQGDSSDTTDEGNVAPTP